MINGSRQAIVFVHGIDQSKATQEAMPATIQAILDRYGVAVDVLKIGLWASHGNFMVDLEHLWVNYNERQVAINTVKDSIEKTWIDLVNTSIEANDPVNPSLLVIGHSMGQILSLIALQRLSNASFPIPISLLSLGGPIGNRSFLSRQYLMWATHEVPQKPQYLNEWIDIYNTDDPVSHSPIFGSQAYPWATSHVKLDFPGLPLWNNPLSEHHSYFETPLAWNIAKEMLGKLSEKANGPKPI